MATNLVNPPQQFTIPVTKGCDRAFTLNRKDTAGAAVDWNASLYMDILIDPNSPPASTPQSPRRLPSSASSRPPAT